MSACVVCLFKQLKRLEQRELLLVSLGKGEDGSPLVLVHLPICPLHVDVKKDIAEIVGWEPQRILLAEERSVLEDPSCENCGEKESLYGCKGDDCRAPAERWL